MTGARTGVPATGRFWITAFGALLPRGFRDRQRGEWAADLLSLSHDPATRRRYLLAVALTLPELRAAARGHDSAVLARPGALTAWRLLTTMLAWCVFGWLTGVLAPFLYLRSHPGVEEIALSAWLAPFAAVLGLGGLATIHGHLLTGVTGLTALVLAFAERHNRIRGYEDRSLAHRAVVAGTASVILLTVCVQPALESTRFHADGDVLGLLALASLPLMAPRTGLSLGRRALLGLLAVAAAAIVICYRTPFGHDLSVWLHD